MNPSNGFADFAKKFNQFGDNIKRVFNDGPAGQSTRRTASSSDDVLGLDAEAFREAMIEGNDGGELATYVNEKLVFEAGVDYESRPMLVFAACRMLNPDVVDYDRLLNLIQFRLDDFVESDYTVVLFAANARYNPSIKWLYTAYRRLGRKYKKNLKALYIVHPSKWVQFLMTAMNAVLSPKFAKKVKWIDTLSGLAHSVPIDQINIPPEVYQFNATKEAEIKVPTHAGPSSRFFGVSLESLMGTHGELGLPAPVADSLDYLYTHALEVQDLFRRSPSSTTLHKVRNQYETEGHISVTYAVWGEHVAAAILKTWCRELPQPIIPPHYYELIRLMPDPESQPEQAAAYARDVILPALADPPCVSLLLAALFGLLRAVADHSSINNMTAGRLAAAWAPNFVHSSQPDVDISMCSVTRFSDNSNQAGGGRRDGEEDENEDEDEDVLDLGDQDDENRPNVVTLAKLMIDQYQVIFKPTLEAAEAQAKQHAAAAAPPKPPRRQQQQQKGLGDGAAPAKPPRHSTTPADKQGEGEAPVQASEEDIAALVEELGGAGIQEAPPKAVTADDIARRLKAEQEAAVAQAKETKDGEEEDDDEEIVVGDFV
ncbi:Rho GTPase activation protein [Martensiomyces pterosporus]|nr:Rho GTPase activation protein [Martensiomyces pterosporus]